MSGEIDSLSVRLEADVAVFQQQLDRAKAQLSSFAAGTAPAAVGAERVGLASTRAVPGLNKLNNAMVSVTRQMFGLPPIVGQVVDVFGTMAIGTAAMIPLLAGAAGLAWAISKITKESREARAELGKLNQELERLREQQFNPAGIPRLAVARSRVDELQRQLEVARAGTQVVQRGGGIETIIDRDRIAELEKDLRKQEGFVRAGENRITEVVVTAQKKRADEQRKTNQLLLTEQQQWYNEMVAGVRAHHGALLPETAPSPRGAAEAMGFVFPTDAVKGADKALDDLKNTVDELNRKLGLVPVGSVTPGGGSGFMGTIGGNLSQMLDPTMIASGIVTGFASTILNKAIPALADFGKTILGFGGAAEKMAAALRRMSQSLATELAILRGGEGGAIAQNVQDVQRRIDEAWSIRSTGLSGRDRAAFAAAKPTFGPDVDTMAEFEAAMEKARAAWIEAGFSATDWANISEIATLNFERFLDSVNAASDALLHMPDGYKMALAQFNATIPTTPAQHTQRPVVVHVIAEPEGIFRVVEDEGVRRLRTGGMIAWGNYAAGRS